jgi:hypothetical protein
MQTDSVSHFHQIGYEESDIPTYFKDVLAQAHIVNRSTYFP